MPTRFAPFRKAALAAGAAALLLIAACGPGSQPATPPAPDAFTEAGEAFLRGDLAIAANAYRRALNASDEPSPAQEESLYRLALIHALPESPLHDVDQARLFLDNLREQFPDSARGAEVDSILELQSAIAQLDSQLTTARASIDRLQSQRDAAANLAAERDARLEELTRQLDAVQSELETLRSIDRSRRPRE